MLGHAITRTGTSLMQKALPRFPYPLLGQQQRMTGSSNQSGGRLPPSVNDRFISNNRFGDGLPPSVNGPFKPINQFGSILPPKEAEVLRMGRQRGEILPPNTCEVLGLGGPEIVPLNETEVLRMGHQRGEIFSPSVYYELGLSGQSSGIGQIGTLSGDNISGLLDPQFIQKMMSQRSQYDVVEELREFCLTDFDYSQGIIRPIPRKLLIPERPGLIIPERQKLIMPEKPGLIIPEQLGLTKPSIASAANEESQRMEDKRRLQDWLQSQSPKNQEAYSKLSKQEQEVYAKAILSESQISSDAAAIAERNGGTLGGFDFRIKSPASVFEKIYGRDTSTPIAEMNDILRYTELHTPDNLAHAAQASMNQYRDQNYTIDRVKNTWNDDSAYKGINVTMTSPVGQAFEMQYHTEESFNLKNGELHTLYEKARTLNPESEEAIKLNKRMKELSAGLTRPENIENIANYKKGDN